MKIYLHLHYIYLGWRRASRHTILEVVCTVPSGNNIFKPCLLVTHEHATYSCPCEKHGTLRSIPTTLAPWPCDLLIVIAKANASAYCLLLRVKWKSPCSEGSNVRWGIHVISSETCPWWIGLMPTILSFRTATIALVPLQSPSHVDKLRRRMTGHPTAHIRE